MISGYLITSILLTGLKDKTFRLFIFYEKRVRRILPTLLFLITVSIPFSWKLLLPSDFQSYSWQIISSIFSASNFYFWAESSYWSTESILKPLLHTWSLGIEEQFYLVMPFLVILVIRISMFWSTLTFLMLALLSLITSHLMSIHDAQSSFFLLPFRAWELLIGASLAGFQENDTLKHRIHLVPTIGLGVTLASFYYIDENTLHPSLFTLFPIVGVVLIIVFANEKDLATKFLRNKIITFIGLISYGLYLWHFLIFSYLAHAELFESSWIKICAIILTFILSVSTYFLIEKPFRSFSHIKSKTFWLIIGIWSLLLLSFAFSGTNDGFKSRVPALVKTISKPKVSTNHKWFTNKKDSNKQIILVGDSHIAALATTFKNWAIEEGINYSNSIFNGCQLILNMNRVNKNGFTPHKSKCTIKRQRKRLEFILTSKPSIVLIGGRLPLLVEEDRFNNQEGGYEGEMEQVLQNKSNSLMTISDRQMAIQRNYSLTIKKIIDAGHTVVLLYPVPEVGVHVPKELQKIIDGKYLSARDIVTKNPITTSYKVYKTRVEMSLQILDEIKMDKVFRIYPSKIFCDSKIKERCITHNSEVSFYRDDDHLSEFGAELILKQFKQLIYSPNFKHPD